MIDIILFLASIVVILLAIDLFKGEDELIKGEENFERIKDVEIFNIDGSSRSFKKVYTSLNLLPDSILELIVRKNLKIIYSKDSKPVSNGEFSGHYDSEYNYIYIWDNGIERSSWKVVTMIHEIGHFVDKEIGVNSFASCEDTVFHQICTNEYSYFDKYKGNADYYSNNIREYFAQSFAEYYLVKNFKKDCSNTATYIENIIKKIR